MKNGETGMKHPGKTAAQRRILDDIGCGEALPQATTKTLLRMVEDGLLRRLPDKRIGADRFGAISVPQFEMTISTHIAWCEFQAEQFDKEKQG